MDYSKILKAKQDRVVSKVVEWNKTKSKKEVIKLIKNEIKKLENEPIDNMWHQGAIQTDISSYKKELGKLA